MELIELKRQITQKALLPYYVFTGTELGIMDIYLKDLAEAAGTDLLRVDSVADLIRMAGNKSIISRPKCYVVRDDKDYLSQEKTWVNLITMRLQGRNDRVVIIYTNLDKRSKFLKYHTEMNCLVSFDPLIPEVLAKHIRKELLLPLEGAKRFAIMCDCDYSRIMLELDKLKTYGKALGYDLTQEAKCDKIHQLALQNGLFYLAPKDKVFEMIDAIGSRQAKAAFTLVNELNQIVDSPLGALSLLYIAFRNMLLVAGAGKGDLFERTGLEQWKAIKAQTHLSHYGVSEVLANLQIIRDTEIGIKTGTIEAPMALEYVITKILWPKI